VLDVCLRMRLLTGDEQLYSALMYKCLLFWSSRFQQRQDYPTWQCLTSSLTWRLPRPKHQSGHRGHHVIIMHHSMACDPGSLWGWVPERLLLICAYACVSTHAGKHSRYRKALHIACIGMQSTRIARCYLTEGSSCQASTSRPPRTALKPPQSVPASDVQRSLYVSLLPGPWKPLISSSSCCAYMTHIHCSTSE
jgi:hypothetical protein